MDIVYLNLLAIDHRDRGNFIDIMLVIHDSLKIDGSHHQWWYLSWALSWRSHHDTLWILHRHLQLTPAYLHTEKIPPHYDLYTSNEVAWPVQLHKNKPKLSQSYSCDWKIKSSIPVKNQCNAEDCQWRASRALSFSS